MIKYLSPVLGCLIYLATPFVHYHTMHVRLSEINLFLIFFRERWLVVKIVYAGREIIEFCLTGPHQMRSHPLCLKFIFYRQCLDSMLLKKNLY